MASKKTSKPFVGSIPILPQGALSLKQQRLSFYDWIRFNGLRKVGFYEFTSNTQPLYGTVYTCPIDKTAFLYHFSTNIQSEAIAFKRLGLAVGNAVVDMGADLSPFVAVFTAWANQASNHFVEFNYPTIIKSLDTVRVVRTDLNSFSMNWVLIYEVETRLLTDNWDFSR